MFYMEPVHMMLSLFGMALVFLPQVWVKNTYKKFSGVPSSRSFTGAQVAEEILRANGVYDVRVEATPGFLSDHYDPRDKTVRLSEEIYSGRSIAGAAIAAHEVGHAIQHATGYAPVTIRSALVPAVNIGSNIGPILIMVALGLGFMSEAMPDWAWYLAWLGVAFYGAAVLFHVVTLPVEIDASMRAVKILANGHYLTTDELPAARKVLTAAACTYIATALYSLMELAYWIWRLTSARRD